MSWKVRVRTNWQRSRKWKWVRQVPFTRTYNLNLSSPYSYLLRESFSSSEKKTSEVILFFHSSLLCSVGSRVKDLLKKPHSSSFYMASWFLMDTVVMFQRAPKNRKNLTFGLKSLMRAASLGMVTSDFHFQKKSHLEAPWEKKNSRRTDWKAKSIFVIQTLTALTGWLAITLCLVQSLPSLQASNSSPPACSLISEILCVFA